MAIKASTLRPGLLVSLKTSLSGNVTYRTQTLDAEQRTDDGAAHSRWETERTVADPIELEAGKQARSKARSIISRVCSHSAFGLLCPETNAQELEDAISAARAVADNFNAGAKLTRLSVFALTGRIASDDESAIAAINSEIRDLLADMERGVAGLDATVIREAANKARGLGQMLSPEAEARLQVAVKAARDAATAIVKAGESAAIEVDRQALRKIAESRTAFLDLDEAPEVRAAAPVAGRAVDFQPGAAPIACAPAARALDLFA